MAAAVAALSSADYSSALAYAVQAQGYLAALPDSEQSDRALSWDAKKINDFIGNVRTLKTESQQTTYGIQRTKVTPARPSVSTL